MKYMSMIIILLIALCVLMARKAHGQIAPGALHRLIGNPIGSLDPETIIPFASKKRYWYKATDLSSSPVSDWVDRVSAYHWWQGTGAKQPTWDTNGVSFNGTSHVLFATNAPLVTTVPSNGVSNSVLFIFKMDSVAANQMLLCKQLAAGDIYVGFTAIGTLYSSSGPTMSGFGTNQVYDLLICKTGASEYKCFTNGMPAWTNNAPFNTTVNLTNVGAGAGNGFAK